MSPVPLLDRAHLDAQTHGDAAFAHELLGLFRGQCRRLLPGILDGSAEAADRADRAHSLRGSALGVGAGQVARVSAEVEDRLRARTGDAPVAALAATVAATLAEIDGTVASHAVR